MNQSTNPQDAYRGDEGVEREEYAPIGRDQPGPLDHIGRQPQVTLRMHVDHESLFRWLMATFPGGRLYGPYNHSGRRYFQWMARGPYLRTVLIPLLDARLRPEIDGRTWERYRQMKERYRL